MANASTVLVPSTRRGFSLIEVLIALALVSVVMGLAWIVLDSTRRVAEEINRPLPLPLSAFSKQLQTELDQLLLHPTDIEDDAFTFSPEEGLKLVTLIPGAQGIPLQTQLQYLREDKTLLRISTSGFPPTSQTNVVIEGLSFFSIYSLEDDQATSTTWPPEKDSPLPARIAIDFKPESGDVHTQFYYIPASFRIEKSPVIE